VTEFARNTRVTFVPSWVTAPTYRGYGPLDLRPGAGVAALLAQMNQTLAESFRSESNVFVLDTSRWFSSIGQRGWSTKLWYASKIAIHSGVVRIGCRRYRRGDRRVGW
jgi:predicted enzyme involved in methoxymalonyl-ACP biosynthesis